MGGDREVEAENAFAEHDHVHVYGLEEIFTVLVLVEGTIVDKVVISEEFHFLSLLLDHDILCRERMDTEGFGEDLHLRLCRAQDI